MKFSFALLFALAVTSTSLFGQTGTNCQTLNLRQLLTLTSRNLDQFETFVRSKCYYQIATNALDGGQEYNYQYRHDEISNGDVVRTGIFGNDESRKFVAYLTISEAKYGALRGELAALGFRYIDTKVDGATTTKHYTSAQYDLYINHISTPGKYKYNFSVFRR